MKELVIDGNVWGRGHSSEPLSSCASLYHEADGVERQCCIEILGRSLGHNSRLIGEYAYGHIAELAGLSPNFDWLPFYSTNDRPNTPDDQRAEKLRVLFREIGYELKFVNVPGVDGCPLEAQ